MIFCSVATTRTGSVPSASITRAESCWLPRPSRKPWPPITVTTAFDSRPAIAASTWASEASRTISRPSSTMSTPSGVEGMPSTRATSAVVPPGPSRYRTPGSSCATTPTAARWTASASPVGVAALRAWVRPGADGTGTSANNRGSGRPSRRSRSSRSSTSASCVGKGLRTSHSAASIPAAAGATAKHAEYILTPAGTPSTAMPGARPAATSRAVPSPPAKRMRDAPAAPSATVASLVSSPVDGRPSPGAE